MPERTSRDEHGCRNAGLPLGGLGAGSVELRPDGYFYRWLVMNNRPWGAGPATDAMERYGLRFGACVEFSDGAGGTGAPARPPMGEDARGTQLTGGDARATTGGDARATTGGDARPPTGEDARGSPPRRVLALGKHHGLDPGPDGWFWFSDPYHLPWVEHAAEIRYRAQPPFARLEYAFADLPLRISLEAWSPFIPHQADDSGTPGAVLTFRVNNPTNQTARVALFGLLKNAAGYGHPELVSRIERLDGPPAGLLFTRDGAAADAVTQGTLGLFVLPAAEQELSWALHPRHGRDLFDPLRQTGRLENQDYSRETGTVGEIGAEKKSEGPQGLTRGALAAHLTIPAGETRECTFLLTWCFPNFMELDYRGKPGRRIGVHYAERFDNAAAVARWLARDRPRLEAQTLAFQTAFYESTLPGWMLDAVAASLTVLRRAAWWDREGRFAVWEGLGCCGLQTIDVGHYSSWPILQFFPELEASQNRLSAALCEPTGKVPHLAPGTFCCSDYSGKGGRVDLGAQYVLAIWRHTLWTGDPALARETWPVIERNLALLAETDANGDGLPDNRGSDQTYDRFPLYGTSAFVGFLYLAALRAAAELAGWLDQPPRVEHYRGLATRAEEQLQRQLWNGEYYSLSHDPQAGTSNSGCMTDQLNGEWFFRQASGRRLLEDARVRQALLAVARLNRRTAGPRGWLANCTWPKGGGIEITRRGSDQAKCPWSGVEYAVAAHLLLLGERDAGRQVAWDAFQRYEDAGMRFNHLECGEFYYRWMSAWAVYLAEFGVTYDGFRQCLSVSPEGDARFLATAPAGSVQVIWAAAAGDLTLRGLTGRLPLRAVSVCGREVALEPVALTPGQELRVKVPVA